MVFICKGSGQVCAAEASASLALSVTPCPHHTHRTGCHCRVTHVQWGQEMAHAYLHVQKCFGILPCLPDFQGKGLGLVVQGGHSV